MPSQNSLSGYLLLLSLTAPSPLEEVNKKKENMKSKQVRASPAIQDFSLKLTSDFILVFRFTSYGSETSANYLIHLSGQTWSAACGLWYINVKALEDLTTYWWMKYCETGRLSNWPGFCARYVKVTGSLSIWSEMRRRMTLTSTSSVMSWSW